QFYTFTIEPSWRFDSRNRNIFPTSGQSHRLSATVAVPGGDLTYLKGEYDLARRYALEGLGKFEEINHRWGIAVSFGRLGLAELELGQWNAAVGHFLECLDQATEAGLVPQQHYAVTGIGRALVKAGRYQEAGRLLGFEANADANPYREFAQAGLDSIPTEVRAEATSESIDFTAAVELCRRAADTLIGPGEVSEQVSDA
ncbi:MAG: BamA/TamA family outer membrane protein, partial [Acidimicrobiia bacterium]|nr:BamA/TamA family outer membrane protein [Acidimicrobiia bacterium]